VSKSTKHKKTSFLQHFVFILNILAVFFLLLAYISQYISPISLWPLAFIGLSYPFLLLLNLAFVLYWIFRKRVFFLLSLLAILAGWNFIGRYFQVSGKTKTPPQETCFKILSFNVHNLTENNFNKISNKQNDIFNYVVEESPDIVCMQEYYSQGENYYYSLINLKNKLKADNYFFQSYYGPKKSKIVGLAIFSKLKRLKTGYLNDYNSSKKFGIFADFIFKQDTFRVFNLHLESLKLQREDYNTITGQELGTEKKELGKRSQRIAVKIKNAFQARAKQVKTVQEEIGKSPYPVIICGDFNDTPASYAYHGLSNGLSDAFIESGSGIGKTFSTQIPFFRIDYIFYDPIFTASGYKAKSINLSDHYPVSCFLTSEK
jgi:endonuclease/exonuclease/phosphatase family metal-dependent hydrolase